MQDTMGQAAALTGGYGNSYATSAGSQAYQSYLNQLNERIPELMQLALSAYNAEGDRLNNNFAVLQADRNTAYGEYADKYDRLIGDRAYYGDNYNTVYSQDYAAWADNRSYDQTQYWNEYNAGYQAERDSVADSQWQQQFDYQKERDEVADSQWQKSYDLSASKSSSGGSGNGKTTTAKTPTQAMFDEALAIYNEGGDAALDKFFDKYPDYDKSKIMAYCREYGDVHDSKAVADRTWTVTDYGGWNLIGVNDNAVLEDQYGNQYKAKDLYNALIADGMSPKDAQAFLRKLGVSK
jgi:hypothetical protein